MKTLAILLFLPFLTAYGQDVPKDLNHPFADRIVVKFDNYQTTPVAEESNYNVPKSRLSDIGFGPMDSGLNLDFLPVGLPVINLEVPVRETSMSKGEVIRVTLEPEFHPERNLVRYNAVVEKGLTFLSQKTVLKIDLENAGEEYTPIGTQKLSWTTDGYATDGWMHIPVDGPMLVTLSVNAIEGEISQVLQTVYLPD